MSQRMKSNNNKVYRVVLTGGPCGGKTTGQARLCTFFESIGWKVYRVPEISSILAGGGVKLGSEMSDEMLVKLYKNVLEMAMQIEDTFFDLAASCSENCLIICDGGLMDVRANLTDNQWKLLMAAGGWNDVDLRDWRYNQVVHMVSVACAANGRRRHFSSHGGMDMETARHWDSVMAQAWVGHPYYDVIDNSTDFDRKLVRMIAAVCDRLDIHIGDRLATDSYKRKFLIKTLPDISLFPQFQDFTVVHDYLVTPNQKMQARIRRRGQNANWTYTHTIRCPLMSRDSSRDMSREVPELKMQVTSREYQLLLVQKDSSHHTVYKTRRCFLANNQYFQMDIYEEPCPSRCNGLILLETYTSAKGDDFELPSFLEIEKEVTGDPAYSMYNLSKKDMTKGSDKTLLKMKSADRPDDELVENGKTKKNGFIGAMDLAENVRARRISECDTGRSGISDYSPKSRSGSLVSDRDFRVVRFVERNPEKEKPKKKERAESAGCGHDDMLAFRQERFPGVKRNIASQPALCRVAL